MRWAPSVALLLMLAPAARAGVRTVTVLEFAGPNGAAVSNAIDEGLGELYETIDGGVYRIAADRMGKAGASAVEVAAVCGRQRIDAVVAGAVRGGARGALRLVVRDGHDGSVPARLEYPLPHGRLGEKLKARILSDLVRVFEQVRGVTGAQRPRGTAGPSQAEAEEEDEDSPERPQGARPTGEDEQEEEEAPKARVVRRATPRRGVGVEAGVGFGLLTRTLDLHNNAAVGYQGSAVATVRFDGAIFPFGWTEGARSEHPALSTFGIGLAWVEALPFQSLSADNSRSAAGHARRWEASLLSRIPTGGERAPVIELATGGGQIVYGSDDPVAVGVPDVIYGTLHFSASVAVPLGTPKVELGIAASILGVVSAGQNAGQLAAPSEYGGGSGWGGDGSLMLTVRPWRGLWLRAGARATGLSLSFGGSGGKVSTGALDSLFDGALEIGYAG